jgi:hypothetical protein
MQSDNGLVNSRPGARDYQLRKIPVGQKEQRQQQASGNRKVSSKGHSPPVLLSVTPRIADPTGKTGDGSYLPSRTGEHQEKAAI